MCTSCSALGKWRCKTKLERFIHVFVVPLEVATYCHLISLLAILALWFSGSGAALIHPNIFVPIANVSCQSTDSWMNNAEGQNPCLAVAYLGHNLLCRLGTRTIRQMGQQLLLAIVCQGPDYVADIKTYFPSGYVLDGTASIPNWALTNPTTWPSGVFNVELAQNYSTQDKPDYVPSATPSGSSSGGTNVGAIVGGTVGGAAALLIFGIGGYVLYKRKQYRRVPNVTTPNPLGNFKSDSSHGRWPSDTSAIWSQSGQSGTSSPPPMSYDTTQPMSQYGMSRVPPSSFSTFQAASPPPRTDITSYTTHTGPQRNHAIPMV
ncbi:hypothetical protein HYDPIDRAFT_170167 [Hydnomerulius pinastri MD-312]|uniref:Transmembrane protein n=1 Tax=Hydnomerulius pinastri MD-312 TaxID=994086 RepID=A0A0C9WAK1_9AGAM|nr:hypothetical protein HYDPIDRAFT_170167 [Hydnomerulius pinastri MD-312]